MRSLSANLVIVALASCGGGKEGGNLDATGASANGGTGANGSGGSSGVGGDPTGGAKGDPAGGAGGDPAGGASGEGTTGGAPAASGGLAGAGGSAGALVTGTCGVLRRIPLPDVPLASTPVVGRAGRDRFWPGFVQRVDGEFRVGPWLASDDPDALLAWQAVSDDGETITDYSMNASLSGSDIAAFSMVDPARLTLVFAGNSMVGGGYIDSGATEVTSGDIYLTDAPEVSHPRTEGSMGVSFSGTSLDGKRGIASAGIEDTAFITFGTDGNQIGDIQEGKTGADCWRHIPTASGNAILEGLNLREFSESGELVLDYQLSGVTLSPCPEAALTQDGFGIVALDDAGHWRLHRVTHEGTASVESWPTVATPMLTLAFFGDMALVVNREGMLFRVEDGLAESFPFEEADLARPIPAEPGTLLLDIAPLTDAQGMEREIVELGCED